MFKKFLNVNRMYFVIIIYQKFISLLDIFFVIKPLLSLETS